MNDITVALVQLNTTVGALTQNAASIAERARKAAAAGATVIVFPELALSGYPPEDLVLKQHFLEDCRDAAGELAARLPPDTTVIVGSPWPTANGGASNSAIVFAGGRIVGRYDKMVLPNYGVFDEKRVFQAGERAALLRLGDRQVGLHICEDSWDTGDRACASFSGVRLDALINISASPYHRGKLDLRQDAMGKAARFLETHILYCNLVGGQDELVFDGASLVLGPGGELLARATQFEEDILYFRLPAAKAPSSKELAVQISVIDVPAFGKSGSGGKLKNTVAPELDDVAEVYAALKLGLRDYVNKNGFKKVVVALSGGIDSALVATLAVDALGHERVAGVTMPSQYSSQETLTDAGLVAKNLGIQFLTVPIRSLFDAYIAELAPAFKGTRPDITEENLQARIRGNIVMALSNKFGWLVLTTGNKSELATGYCTLYGDMAGGFAVIKDVPKTLVFDLARWRNRQAAVPVIPPSTIDRPPTAELRPDQKDTDSLPPYNVLDPILERYIERDMSAEEMAGEGFEAATVRRVARMVDHNEYKRRQGAPGIKITPKAFGRDRRMPITNLYRDDV